MAAPSVTLRSSSTNLFIAAAVTAVVFFVILLTEPTSAFPLGVLGLMPYLMAAFIISGAVARTAAVVLEQQAAWRDEPILAAQSSTGPRPAGGGPAPRWTNKES